LFAAIGVALLAIVMIVVLVLPKMTEVTGAEDKLAAAEAQEVALLSRHEALEAAQAEAPENEAIIAEVQSQIPEVADESGLMLLLQNAANESGLDVSQFSITEPVFDPATGLSSMTISVSAEGTYFQIADFMYNIQTLPRAAKVTNADMSPSDATTSGSPTLSLSATMLAYTTDADPELPGPQTAPAPEGSTQTTEEGA